MGEGDLKLRVKEFRIPLPMDLEEYRRGQLYTVVETSKKETGDGEGVEILENTDFNGIGLMGGNYTAGIYTKKIYHLHKHLPKFVRWIIAKEKCQFVEEAWNAFPYCLTMLRNPNYLKADFYAKIETLCLPFHGTFEANALRLDQNRLESREIEILDICRDDQIRKGDYNEKYDPKLTRVKGRVLDEEWLANGGATICIYKVVTLHFKWTGLSTRCKDYAMGPGWYPRIFAKMHRELYCTMDTWSRLTMAQVRALEAALPEELNRLREGRQYRGTNAE